MRVQRVQRIKGQQPFVTCLRDDSRRGYQSSKSSLHLLPFMSELHEDMFEIKHSEHVETDQFEKLKFLSQTRFFDCRNNEQNKKTDLNTTTIISPQVATSKEISLKVSEQLRSFTRATTAKRTANSSAPRSVSRDKSKIVQDIKDRMQQSLNSFIRNNHQKHVQEHIQRLTQQNLKKTQQLILEVETWREKVRSLEAEAEKKAFEVQIELAHLASERDMYKNQCRQTQIDLEKSKTVTSELRKFQLEYEQMNRMYPDMTCSKLIGQLRRLQQICVNRLGDIDQNIMERFDLEKRPLQQKIVSLTEENGKLKSQLAEMTRIVESRRLTDTMDYQEMQILFKSKERLKTLQLKIMEIFVKWEQNLTDCEKDIMRQYGGLSDKVSYEEMLGHMDFYRRQLSSDHKAREFVRKLLALIKATKRKVFKENIPDNSTPEVILESIAALVATLRKKQKKHKEHLRRSQQAKTTMEDPFVTSI